jgi:hypothetical protein
MQFAELFAKVADEVLRLSGGYRIWFRQGHKGTPTARNPLSGLAEIAGNFSLSAKRAQALLQDKYEIFGKETGLDSFDTQAQVHLPFWRTSWNGFDPKDYWEIARGWQWLPAVLWAKDTTRRQCVLDKIMVWLEKTPCPNGLAWAVGLDVAIRAINLLLIFSLSGDQRLAPHLTTHLKYLRKRLWLSRHAIRNNHYLGELTAIALLSRAFGETGAENYKSRVEVELARQFYQDGVNMEQSIRYHLFSLQFALLARLFIEIDIPFLEKSGEFLLAAMRPDGTWPSIGDDDSGCVFRLHEEGPGGDYKAMLSILALVCERPDFAFAAGRLYPEAEFFLEDAREKWGRLEAKEPLKRAFVFPDGGFLSARSDWTPEAGHLLIKFGPHKWHAHADLFHVEVSLGGRPVFVDSGTYRYNNVQEKRRYFRSTAAHNTVRFGGRDQSRQLRTFRWLEAAQVTTREIQETPEGLACRFAHSGYKSAGIVHERSLDIPEDFRRIRIEDRITGPGKGRVELFWHLHPDVDIRQVADGVFEITAGSERLGTLAIESPADVTAHLEETLRSEAYGHLGSKKTLVIKTKKSSEKDHLLVSTIEPGQNVRYSNRARGSRCGLHKQWPGDSSSQKNR